MFTLNITNPTTIDDILLNKVSMKYDSRIMIAVGETVMHALEYNVNLYNGQFILAVEGAILSTTKATV